MLLPRSFDEDGAEFITGAAAGLDRVAVRAEGDHLRRMVATAEGQVADVVDLQDRFDTYGESVRAAKPGILADRVQEIPVCYFSYNSLS